jgi:hypothetical protein
MLHGVKTLAGVDGIIQVPQFVHAATTMNLTVRSGRRMLLGSFVLTQPAPKILLFLLKAVA